MASKVPSTSNLPWTWAIEALSCYNNVDTSLLIDLLKSAPEISDDLEENVREVITLRILEGLSLEENQNKNDDTPAQGQKTELDASTQDVLRCILEEMSSTDSKIVGPEGLNCDVQSFIENKRTSFPMRALQKLKEAFLEGGHSVLVSLKERSGLAVTSQSDNSALVNLGSSNYLDQKNGESNQEISGNENEESEDDFLDGNLVPAKTTVAATSGENCETLSNEDKIKSDDGSIEKMKQNPNVTEGAVVEKSIASHIHSQLTNASAGIVQHIERDRFHLENKVEIGSVAPQNRDNWLEENFENVNLVPAKKNRTDSTADNSERESNGGQDMLDDGYDFHTEAPKKLKLGAVSTRQKRVNDQIISSLYGQSTSASKEIILYNESRVYNLQPEGKVGSSAPQNRDGKLQRLVPNRNSLPFKRSRVIVTAENSGDDFDSHAEAAKKFKQDMNNTENNLVDNPISSPINGIMGVSSDMIIEDIDPGKCNFENEPPLRAKECNEPPHDSECQGCDASGHLPCLAEDKIIDNKMAEFSAVLNGQLNVVGEGSGHSEFLEPGKLNNTSKVGQEKEVCPERTTHEFEGNLPRNASNCGEPKDDLVNSPDPEMTSDSDEYSDDRLDAALNKDLFLSSQCTYSQDSYTTQSNSCIKCNGDGHLLVCSSNTCQLMVHKSCLPSAGTFYENGKFYCPFCAYSRSISEYLQVKRKASLAKKDLAAFIGVRTDSGAKKSTLRSVGAKQGKVNRNGEFGIYNDQNVDEELMNEVSKLHSQDNMGNRHQAEPSKSHCGENPLCGKKILLNDGSADVSAKSNPERADTGQQLQPPGGNLKRPRASELIKKFDNVCRKSNSMDRNEKNRKVNGKNIQDIRKSTVSLEPPCGSKAESSEEDNEIRNFKIFVEIEKPSGAAHRPPIPQLRRKVLPWSKAEEEKLKEGVQRLSSTDDQTIPWSKIMEYGGGVFQKGRTAVDLKDKWRNICRGRS